MSNQLSELEALSKQIANAVLECDNIRLISHNDADGISAAGIMCNALYRQGILFHTTIVSQFDASTIDMIKRTSSGKLILCDMGSQSELASKLKHAIIIDHHKPTEKHEHLHFNPHLVGIDGSSELSASGGAYMVARHMGDNFDLSGLAIAGAVGDKQVMRGGNRFILEEALEKKVITIHKGLRMGDDAIEELLEYCTDPYLDITGDKDKIKEFLEELGVKGKLKHLSEHDMRKLSSAIVLKLAKQGSLSAIDSLIGEVYTLKHELIPNIHDFVNMLNACGKLEKASIAIGVCMRDESCVEEALSITRKYQQDIIQALKKAEANIMSARNFRYVMLDDFNGMGMIAGIMVRYKCSDKPFIAFNRLKEITKISSRGTRELISAGLDLAIAMREASISVGGTGGGHDIASGGIIPKGMEKKFIEMMDSIIGEQLKR